MNKQFIKLLLIRYASVIIIFFIIRILLMLILPSLDDKYYAIIPMIAAIILAPRLKRLKTQTGNDYFLKWLFSNKKIK